MQDNNTNGDWLRIVEAAAATGLNERSLQRKVQAGELKREHRGYGRTVYWIPHTLNKFRSTQAAVVEALQQQTRQQADTLERATDNLDESSEALRVITEGLTSRVRELEVRNDRLQSGSRWTMVAAACLAAGVAWLSATLGERTTTLETVKATSRQVADTLSEVQTTLATERRERADLQTKFDRLQNTTNTTTTERDGLAALLVGLSRPAEDCPEPDTTPTRIVPTRVGTE